jgi:Ca-activated chloride channel family protein
MRKSYPILRLFSSSIRPCSTVSPLFSDVDRAGSILGRQMGMKAPWLIVVAATLALPSYVTAQQQEPTPKFRSSVAVVSVNAVVKDRKGRFVRGLESQDFQIVEAGEPRQILDFRAETDGPVRVGLLVDASGSMRVGSKAVDAAEAARQIFSAMREQDTAAVFSFDTRLDRVTDFTADDAVLEGSLGRLNPPFGQTSLYDAVAEAASFVADAGRADGRLPQRSALVVLTDGIDTKSRQTTQQVAAIASRIDVPVYFIAVMAPIDDPRTDASPAFDVSGLRELARSTGGDMFIATAPAHASVTARQILDELRHQYVLAFEASSRPGWRPLEVTARDDKLTVRARTGYSAGSSDRPRSGSDASATSGTPAVHPATGGALREQL